MKKHQIGHMPRLCLCLMFALVFMSCAERNSLMATPKTGWEMEVYLIPQADIRYLDLTAFGPILTYKFNDRYQLEEYRCQILQTGLVAGIRISQVNN